MKQILTRFSGKIYPDRTFSIGIVPRLKKSLEDSLYDNRIEESWDSYTEVKNKYGRTKKTEIAFLSKAPVLRRFIKGQESSPKVEKYGSKGITKYGKKNISCIGAIYEEKFKRGRLGFGTCTIPNFDDIILRVIGCEWSEITRRFFQKLRRNCEKIGRAFIYYGCTEIQEKRYRRTGIPVPHLHFGYVCRDKRGSEFYFTAADARRFWRESITESLSRVGVTLAGEEAGFGASIDLQLVKKSVRKYISKYMSKGGKVVQEIVDHGFEKNLPKQWWFACMQSKKWFKTLTIRMTQELCSSFFYGLEKRMYANEIKWCRFVEVEQGEGRYVVFGLVGTLEEDTYVDLREKYGKN